MTFLSQLADLSSMDSSESVHVDLRLSYNVDGEKMEMVFDTKDALDALDNTANEMYKVLNNSISYIDYDLSDTHTRHSQALIEAKREDMEKHSLYSAFVLLWKARNTNEDFVDAVESLIDEWRITESEWDEYFISGPDDYKTYVSKDRELLEVMLGMPVIEEEETKEEESLESFVTPQSSS